MAGSYNHCVTDEGKLREPVALSGMLENGGDVYEAVEEMYGMIWLLAAELTDDEPGNSEADLVRWAQENYQKGLALSPGVEA
jgi:hypothetical protein